MIQVKRDPAFSIRHRLRRALIQHSMVALSRLGARAVRLTSIEQGLEISRDLAYGPLPEQRLDVYRPATVASPLPVLLYIHGGAFATCSKETHRAVAAIYAASAGYLVFNIDYRLAPQHRFPAAIEDACLAWRWVADHCMEWGGDPMRIVVAGESAGGNLALGVICAGCYERPEPYARAVFQHPVRPVAAMPLMPVLQASDPLARRRRRAIPDWTLRILEILAMNYLGERHAPATDSVLFADPIRLLETVHPERPLPPLFCGVGSADICQDDAERLAVAIRHLGTACTLKVYPGEPHVFQALWWRPQTQQFWEDNLSFLRDVAQGKG